jgi:hypothetical protein
MTLPLLVIGRAVVAAHLFHVHVVAEAVDGTRLVVTLGDMNA